MIVELFDFENHVLNENEVVDEIDLKKQIDIQIDQKRTIEQK